MLLLETRHVPFQPLALSALRALVKHSKRHKNLAGLQLRGMAPARGTCPAMGAPNCCLWGLSTTQGCILLSPCHKHTHGTLLSAPFCITHGSFVFFPLYSINFSPRGTSATCSARDVNLGARKQRETLAQQQAEDRLRRLLAAPPGTDILVPSPQHPAPEQGEDRAETSGSL